MANRPSPRRPPAGRSEPDSRQVASDRAGDLVRHTLATGLTTSRRRAARLRPGRHRPAAPPTTLATRHQPGLSVPSSTHPSRSQHTPRTGTSSTSFPGTVLGNDGELLAESTRPHLLFERCCRSASTSRARTSTRSSSPAGPARSAPTRDTRPTARRRRRSPGSRSGPDLQDTPARSRRDRRTRRVLQRAG
jgi:hypothetical protein